MPRLRIHGRGRGLEAALDRLRDQGVTINQIFSQGDDVVVQVAREDVGQLRRAWPDTLEVYPSRHRAAVIDEARAACPWYGDERHLIQVAIADATQYAVRQFAAGKALGEGLILGVICYYDWDDRHSGETFTLAARYTPDEGGWVEVL